jgi:hypothetical protein
MAAIRLVAAVALGLVVTWLWSLWSGQFSNVYVAWAIWMAFCLGYAFIYDRTQEKKQRAIEARKSAPQLIER